MSHDLDDLRPDEIAVTAEFSAIPSGTEVAAWRGDPPFALALSLLKGGRAVAPIEFSADFTVTGRQGWLFA